MKKSELVKIIKEAHQEVLKEEMVVRQIKSSLEKQLKELDDACTATNIPLVPSLCSVLHWAFPAVTIKEIELELHKLSNQDVA